MKNLNRIRRVLSAKLGTEIPKFLNPGGPLRYNAQDPDFIKFTEFSGDRITPFSFRYYAALKSLSPNATPQQLAEQVTGLAPIPGNITVSEAVSNYEKNKDISNNSSNNSRSLIEMEVPGAPVLNPNSAIETAAQDNQTAAMLKREENIKNASLVEPLSTPIHGITVPEPASKNTDVSQLLQKVQTRMKQEAESYNMNLLKQAAKKEMWSNVGTQAGQAVGAAMDMAGKALDAKLSASNSNTTNMADGLYDGAAEIANQFGPVGQIVGTAMKYASVVGDIAQELGGGTDLQTKTDQWMDSSFFSWNIGMLNGFLGKNTLEFGIDQSIALRVGSSYGGSMSDFNELDEKAGKKYGLFSSKDRKKVDAKIATAKAQQNQMGNIADMTEAQRLNVQSMGEQAGLAYSMMTDGGYNQKYTYAAKQGGILELELDIRLEWEPQIEINWELPTFKEGGNIDIVEELEWIPEFKDGNKIRTIEELIEYAKQQNPRFIQRLFEDPRGIKFTDDEGNEAEGSHYLESRGEYVIPRILEIDGELKFLSPQEAIDRAMESGNYLEMTPEEAILFAEKYKQGWPDFFKKFKKGGSLKENDIPETEETSQKNVIPEGALHKNKHHMEHAEGLTKKGIPVIDDNGEQQAEIEHSEIIFTLEVTKKLEEYYKIFYSNESSNKEKEQAALDVGKLLVYQILENTEDRTGLIESCKKGGTLTIKESEVVEDLLDWMPTIMIVEEVKEKIEEEKPKKKSEKSELEKDDLKELVKDVIREALIELLIK